MRTPQTTHSTPRRTGPLKRYTVIVAMIMAIALPSGAFAFQPMTVPEWGCTATVWASNLQPVPYYLNQNGYSAMSFASIESLMQQSFAEWSKPCCSAFESRYMGTTSAGMDGGTNVLIFYESGWPSTLGDVDSTIGVTLPGIYSDCVIRGADIAFNGVGFDFINGDPTPTQWNKADLKSIAVHEMGHFLGLDHTSVSGATMLPMYSNGIVERDLAQDDMSGVCYLYNKTCGCTSPSQCATGETCVNGRCVVPPCTSNAQCTPPEVCLANGQCGTQTCSASSQCASGYTCVGGACYPNNATGCKICQTCTVNADCGANGFCAQFEGGEAFCSQLCPDLQCPGDSQCFSVSDGADSFNICLNPGAGLCPSSYVCGTSPCPALGGDCSSGIDACGGGTDLCLVDSDVNITFCSCDCTTDADCGTSNLCYDLGDGTSACLPSVYGDACATVTCPTGKECDARTGSCVSTVGCPGLGTSCVGGLGSCPLGSDACFAYSGTDICSCACTIDSDCGDGLCVPVGGSPSKLCMPSRCANVTCPPGQICDSASGSCTSTAPADTGTDTSAPADTRVGQDTSQVPTDTTPSGADVGVDPAPDTGAADTSTKVSRGGDSCSCAVRGTHQRGALGGWALMAAVFGLWLSRRRRD